MKKVNAYLLIGLIGTAVMSFHFGMKYGQAMWGDRDIWWTPKTMALPLSQTRSVFELFISDELLQDHIQRKSLSASDSNGEVYKVMPEDIQVRLNNWPEVKASLLHSSIFTAFMLGVSAALLVVGVVQWFASNKYRESKDAIAVDEPCL